MNATPEVTINNSGNRQLIEAYEQGLIGSRDGAWASKYPPDVIESALKMVTIGDAETLREAILKKRGRPGPLDEALFRATEAEFAGAFLKINALGATYPSDHHFDICLRMSEIRRLLKDWRDYAARMQSAQQPSEDGAPPAQ